MGRNPRLCSRGAGPLILNRSRVCRRPGRRPCDTGDGVEIAMRRARPDLRSQTHVPHQYDDQAVHGHRLPRRRVRDVSSDEVAGTWAIFFFYPADFTFVCPTELGDLADNYDGPPGARRRGLLASRPTRTSPTRRGTRPPRRSARSSTPCSGTPRCTISRNFEVLREDQGLADRGTFLVDPDGVIQFLEVTAEGIGRNADRAAPQGQGRPVRAPSTPVRSARPSGKRARAP